MDCKTCKGTGRIEFERGAVVKNCPHCKGTGSAKFIALCDALITPIIKERNEARAERDALRAQVEAMRAAPANERAAAFEACPESNCDWGAFYRGWMARAAMQAKP